MKNIIKIMIVALATITFASCHDVTTDGVTRITYYPSITLLEGPMLTVELGKTFTDPGVIATEGETDITDKVKVSGSVNTNKVGMYQLTYSAINVDGFAGTATRNVYVYDPSITTDLSGSYTVNLEQSNRLQFSNGAIIKYSDMGGLYGGDFSNFTVDLEQFLPGIFHVNDFFGGYYFAGRNYDSRYLMGGYLSLNANNSLDVLSSLVPGWGDSVTALKNASYDPATETIKWGAEYAGSYSFNVVINKK
jgi:hypothetical protein